MITIRRSAQRLLQIRSFPGREGALAFFGLCLLAWYEDGLSIKKGDSRACLSDQAEVSVARPAGVAVAKGERPSGAATPRSSG